MGTQSCSKRSCVQDSGAQRSRSGPHSFLDFDSFPYSAHQHFIGKGGMNKPALSSQEDMGWLF